jgi:serine/threonine-protein kinase
VFDAGEDEGDLYLVMELVEGPTLADRLAHGGSMPVDEATKISVQVLAGLAAAHAAGVVHRDVKPANVLITPSGDVKLADFGIATRFDAIASNVTAVGLVVGTPGYLAPERLRGEPATPAADVYSVGVMLFEMLGGHMPFPGTSPAERTAGAKRTARDVRSIRPDVPSSLSAAIGRALSFDPNARQESAERMAAELHSPWAPPSTGAEVHLRRMAITSAIVAAAIASATFGVLLARHEFRDGASAATPTAATATTPTTPVTKVSSTTVPRTTTSVRSTSTSTSRPRSTTSTLPDIIPGFPATTSINQFLTQLRSDPLLVGDAGPTLVKALQGVLDNRSPKKQAEAASSLRRSIAAWSNDGSLDPDIADALDTLLRHLATR